MVIDEDLVGSVGRGLWIVGNGLRDTGYSLLVTGYRGTSLITCGDFDNACLSLQKIKNFSKNGCLFLRKLKNFSKNGCLFLEFFRPLPLCGVVSHPEQNKS